MSSLDSLQPLLRHGSLISSSMHSLRSDLERAASTVQASGHEKNCFEAPTAFAAAAWLLGLAHRNALGPGFDQILTMSLAPSDWLLGFRGQATRYSQLTPSLYRKTQD